MPRIPSQLRHLLSELARRRVIHAVGVYAVAAWVAVQVANIVVPALFLPPETLTVLVFVAVLGFPVTVALAWAFEISTEGIRRTPQPATDGSVSPSVRVLFAGVVLVLTAGMGWYGWQHWLSPRTESLPVRAGPGGRSAERIAAGEAGDGAGRSELPLSRVAVLYLDDHSPGDTLASYTEAFTENLIHRLAQVDGLEVVSRHGVEPYRGQSPPLDSVARVLGAGSLVEGSVAPAGDSLAVTVQLIDGESQDHLMSTMVRQPVEDVFAIQDSLARKVSRLLRKRLGREVQLESWRAGTDDARAWRLVQRADQLRQDAESRRLDNEPDLARDLFDRADSLLVDADRRDPDWPVPEVERARLIASRLPNAHTGAWEEQHRRLARRGIAHAEDALQEDSANAEALRLRGQLLFWLARNVKDGDRSKALMERAERDLHAAVREAPGSARAWFALSALAHEGRSEYEEARYYAQRARKADAYLELPFETTWRFYQTADNAGKYDEAAYWCREGQRQYPSRVRFYACELQLMATRGGIRPDGERAWTLLDTIRTLSLERNRARFVAFALPQVAAVLARADRSDSARAVLRRARRDSPNADDIPYIDYHRAHAYTLLGEEERAVDLLARFLEHEPGMRKTIRNGDWFEPLRDRARFQKLVRER